MDRYGKITPTYLKYNNLWMNGPIDPLDFERIEECVQFAEDSNTP